MKAFLEENVPAYILYRLDSRSSSGHYEWLIMSYVPDKAKVPFVAKSNFKKTNFMFISFAHRLPKVRDKMLYASTRAALTKDLGDSRFVDSMYGTVTVSISANTNFPNFFSLTFS